jgi:ABC-type dipeptide/oligopeptide/nickel transport systems, permease components
LLTFAEDRLAAAGLVGLVALGLVVAVGPLVLPRPAADPTVALNPPVRASVQSFVPPGCVGEVVADRCRGSWRYPFGTDGSGRDILLKTVYGLQTSLQVGVTTAVIAGGVGAVVGLVAGTLGGRADTVLMRYVDFQTAVPAFFVYLLAISAFGHDLAVMVLVFGFLSWGGLARLVRSEVLRVRAELYVRSAHAAGADPLYRLRRHVLPNVSAGVVVPLTSLVPLYVLYEAALSFLGLGDPEPMPVSLGETISSGLERNYVPNWWDAWWISVIPAVALSVLLVCLLVAGDRAGELLDPQER